MLALCCYLAVAPLTLVPQLRRLRVEAAERMEQEQLRQKQEEHRRRHANDQQSYPVKVREWKGWPEGAEKCASARSLRIVDALRWVDSGTAMRRLLGH